jgi:hypothetical protein
MATQKQIAANRENAARSTGPLTKEGKQVSRHNALKHGLLSKVVLLMDEEQSVYLGFAAQMREQLKPDSEMEELLVDRIVTSTWRLRRAIRVESSLFDELREDLDTPLSRVGINPTASRSCRATKSHLSAVC